MSDQWPVALDGLARPRPDARPRRPALHDDARRHGRRRHQGRAARHRRRHARLGAALRRAASPPTFSASTATSARSRSTWRSKPGQEMLAQADARGRRRSSRTSSSARSRNGASTTRGSRSNAPRAVRCSITGYGTTGPKAALPGYDFILQAESGLMSICGETDGAPMKYGVAIVDICTGMLACNSILAALNARHRTGKRPEGRSLALRDLARSCSPTSRRTI